MFIKDPMRESYLNIIHARIRKGKSSLIAGKYGSGKSWMLNEIKPKKKRIVMVESLEDIHHILPDILRQLSFDVRLNYARTTEYLKLLTGVKDAVIMIDECNELRPDTWAYLKRIMNSRIPLILAGKPEIITDLRRKYQDILARLKVLELQPVTAEIFKQHLTQFEGDAVDILYAASEGNLYRFDELCDECADKAEELKQERITAETAAMFI